MTTSFKWKLRAADDEKISVLARDLNVSATFARILFNRKIFTAQDAQCFLDCGVAQVHSPLLLKDMDVAVDRLVKAIDSKEKICIYGDYDVDGAIATSLLLTFFEELGLPAEFYIPNRMAEGYSLNNRALEIIAERGVKLIITVDNGIMAHREALFAQKLGLDLIITDHHQVADTLPPAIAIINPQRRDCSYPFKGICGAGVAFKLIMALRQRLRDQKYFSTIPEPNLKKYLDFLAIATVCDVVPLVDENRYFVREGLRVLAATERIGLRALLKVSAVESTPSAVDLGFRLGPRINACGRLEDASMGVMLLTSKDNVEAMRLARLLDGLNQERRDIELKIVTEITTHLEESGVIRDRLGLVVCDESWHEGVVGIVASRVVEKFKRPVFVLGKNEQGLLKGSGRSVAGVSLIAALNVCSDLFEKFGGHEAAAGVTLKPENLSEFSRRFDEAIKMQMTPRDLQETVWVDDVLEAQKIDERLMQELKRLEPHGMGNAKPVFVAEELSVVSKRVVGDKHLKLKMGDGQRSFDAIAFGKGMDIDAIQKDTGVIFGLEINQFRGNENIQLIIKDFLDS